MRNIDLAYAAGIIDGEGTVFIAKTKPIQNCIHPRYCIRVQVQMSQPEVCTWLKDNWGGGLSVYRGKNYKPHWKTAFIWVLGSKAAYLFLKDIRSYLKIKHRQAQICIAFQKECIKESIENKAKDVKGKFIKGHGERSKKLLEKQENLRSLLSRFNQYGFIWSDNIKNIPGIEKHKELIC